MKPRAPSLRSGPRASPAAEHSAIPSFLAGLCHWPTTSPVRRGAMPWMSRWEQTRRYHRFAGSHARPRTHDRPAEFGTRVPDSNWQIYAFAPSAAWLPFPRGVKRLSKDAVSKGGHHACGAPMTACQVRSARSDGSAWRPCISRACCRCPPERGHRDHHSPGEGMTVAGMGRRAGGEGNGQGAQRCRYCTTSRGT